MPWRHSKDPYTIWVSEIILQQTRIDQGLDYFNRFILRFPNIKSLAAADEEEVLKLWQGLGYYSRARNMHSAAREILQHHKGNFPDTFESILKLKGVGTYTASAIASLAYGLPTPVVDGNVIRFVSRYFGIITPVDSSTTKKEIYGQALKHLDRKDPGTFNQAMMEFGAIQCRPGKPDCGICPFLNSCFAYNHDMVEKLPLKGVAQVQRTRYFHYLVILDEDVKGQKSVYLNKREENDIWRNLYDFPVIETSKALSQKKLTESDEWKKIFGTAGFEILETSEEYRHVLSHQVIHARFYHARIEKEHQLPFQKVSIKDVRKYPVPRLIENYIEKSFADL